MMNKQICCQHMRDNDSLISLLASDISAWYSKSQMKNIDVSIPKLSLSNNLPLKDCLQLMNVKDLFTPYLSDLSNISRIQSSVTDIFQYVNIKIDEEGVVDAAATACSDYVDDITDHKPIKFKLDRPFVLLIFDKLTQLIVFANLVVDPSNG
ncbi:hypothetical protein MXB_3153 [Myxobolus squamalis]|nr:hypothetical protein MXB_3153 [Myxobolus squamalis]